MSRGFEKIFFRRPGGGSRVREPLSHFVRFMTEADFLAPTILGTLSRDRSEAGRECFPFGSVHYIGFSEVGGHIGVSFRGIHREVGVKVGALANRSAGAFDLDIEAIGAEVVAEIVGFRQFARKGEAENLFGVLSVVLIFARDGEQVDSGHLVYLSFLYTYIISHAREFVKGFSQNKKNFFRAGRAGLGSG